MKSLDNLTMIQVLDRYRDIIGDDFENFIYAILKGEVGDDLADKIKAKIDSNIAIKDNKKERQTYLYQFITKILDDSEKDGPNTAFKRRIILEIMRRYPKRIKTGTNQEMKKFLLEGTPVRIYKLPAKEGKGLDEHVIIITEDDEKSIDTIHDDTQRLLFKTLINTITPADIKTIVKSKYGKEFLIAMSRNIAIDYFINNKKMKKDELKKLLDSEKIELPKEEEPEFANLIKQYFLKNFQVIDRELLLLNGASKLMLGLRLGDGEKIKNLTLLDVGSGKCNEEEKIENNIMILKTICRELEKMKSKDTKYKMTDEKNNVIIETSIKDIEEFLSKCTDTKYLSDFYIEKLHENLANGIFPENLEELKIAKVGLEDVTNIINNYEIEDDEKKKEKLLDSSKDFVEYLIMNTDVKPEDIIELYINGNANLELIKAIELDELPKEYFDTRFIELFGEDVYLDTPESNAKLKRYGNLYSMLREQKQIDTTTDDLVEKLSTMFGEEFIPNIMGELYKIGVANIEEALQWLGGEFLNEQYKQENLKPVEIRKLYDNGIIKHDELISMIKLLKDNTEKFMVISSLFPEQESIDIRQELSERCLDLGEGAREEEKGTKRKKVGETSKDYNKYITDPVSRFMLMKLLDKEYSFKMTSDGHAVMFLPNYEKVIIEKMLDKNGRPYYGAATYVLDEEYFDKNKNEIIVEGDKIKRSKLNESSSSKSVEKLVHSATGWGKGIKKVFEIDEETKTPENLEQIEEAIKAVEESRTKIER